MSPGAGLPRITVVGLGPADVDLLTAGTLDAIASIESQFLRTSRHPAASALPGATSFDPLYEEHETFAEVYAAIVEALVDAADAQGHVLYAVPGSPQVAEHTVELLRADERVELTVLPALSFADLTWSRLGIDPLHAGVTIIDGHRFAEDAAGLTGPFLVAQCDQEWVLSDIKLTVDDPEDELTVTAIQRLGLPDESIMTIKWNDLDREVTADHLTSLYISALPATTAKAFADFEVLVARLRTDCPWDAEQTHDSLRRYLLEETYETLEAIDGIDVESGHGYEHLAEELGDLLYQVFFHAVLATEQGEFSAADIATGIHNKLYTRHPHVFGDVQVADTDEVISNWESIKKAEKGRSSVMEGIPEALPALLYALKVQKKASSQGFGLADMDAALADVDDELTEFRAEPSVDEAGDLLFAAVQVTRQLGTDPETALRDAARRFRDRFMFMEAECERSGRSLDALTPADQRALWAEAKKA